MQAVSDAWKSNHKKTLVSESFVEVSLDIADPDSLADASSRDNGAVYISNTSQVVSEVDRDIVPYSTLEQNMWVLDGNRKVLPEKDIGDCGFVGDLLSGADCGFTGKTPLVTVDFTRVHQNLIPAVTITWGKSYGEFARDFTVTAYNKNEVVAKKSVTGNTKVQSIVRMDIINYDRITISVLRWCLPYHRPRIEEIFLGMHKVYSKSDLFEFTHSQTVDPITASLPKFETTFSVSNIDGEYDPYNEEGMSKYLMSRQEVKTRFGYKMDEGHTEWIKGGTFYLSEWDAPQNGIKANFAARDLLEFMSEMFYEGVFNSDGTNLYDLAVQILTKADLPLNSDGTLKWSVSETLKDIYTTAPLPIDTLANCLQMIANAGGCAFYQDREGTLRIEPLSINVSDYEINHKNSFTKPDMKLSKPLKQVNVGLYQYISSGTEQELYNGILHVSGETEVWLEYSNTAVYAFAQVMDGTIEEEEYYANACRLKISGDGEVSVVVLGIAVNESKTEIVTNSGATGEIITIDNPLITSVERAVAIGRWVEGYMKNRVVLSTDWRPDPRLDALDVVRVENDYNEKEMLMTDVTLDFSGAFRGKGEGRVI